MTGVEDRPPTRLDPDELAALEEQRDFLLRSLDDLDRERAAGDLDDHDYETLRDDYTARAAETLRAIEEHRTAYESARRPVSRGRLLAILAGVVVFAVVAGLLVANALGAREAGDTASGGITTRQSPSQRAQGCIPLMQSGPAEAIECFQGVLDDDPRNPVALTWLGWTLELSTTGLEGAQADSLRESATALVDRAVEADPDYSYARAFRAVLAFRRGEHEAARRYLEEFRAGDPSPDAEAVIQQMDLDDQIAEALGEDPPASTTTTPTGSTAGG